MSKMSQRHAELCERHGDDPNDVDIDWDADEKRKDIDAEAARQRREEKHQADIAAIESGEIDRCIYGDDGVPF